MRLVAVSYDPQELNRVAFELYASFRPEVDGWGKKAEIKCSTILASKLKSSSDGNVSATSDQVEEVKALLTSSGVEVDAKYPLVEN